MKTSERISLSVFALSLALWLISCAGGGAAQNPAPSVASIAPASAMAGGAAFTLTVNGSNFISTSVVRWNGSGRSTTFVSSTELTVAISAADIANAGTANVNVFNPAPGGGTSNGTPFSINNPAPAVSGLNPANATAGDSAFTLTVDGSNFVSSSVVQWNGSSRPTTFVSSTRLSAAIPASDIATSGTAQVTVLNPTPGGGASNASAFNIGNPMPAITSLSPASAIAGDAPMILTVTGSNFVWGAVVRWNGTNRSTTFIDATRLDAQILATDLAVEGSAQVTVANFSGGAASQPVAFSIAARTSNPQPTIVSASDSKAPAGWPGFALTLTGSGFVAASVVQWNGLNRPTTVLSNTQLRAAIPLEDLAAAGTAQVAVFNPSPGGGTSNALDFTIYAVAPNAVGVIDRASVGEGFTSGDSYSWDPAISADSRYVAFASTAGNLVPGDGNNDTDIFLRDTCLGAPAGCTPSLIRLPLSDHGWYVVEGTSISATGRYVAYIEYTGQNNTEVVVADTCIGAPAGCLPSVSRVLASYETFYGGWIEDVSLSGNGRYVVYNGSDGYTSGSEIADTCLGASDACVPSKSGLLVHMYSPVLSTDGRYVVFESDRSDLVANDTNNATDIFLEDTCSGAPAGCTPSTIRVSVDSNGVEGNSNSFLGAVSGDGRFVAFTSFATNLVPGDTNGGHDVFLRDTCIGAPAGCTPSTIRVSVANDGSQADAPSGGPAAGGASLSTDGRFVAFGSRATNLVSGDTNGTFDIFVRDTCLGVSSGCTPSTVRVSVALDGTEGDDRSDVPRITADGRYVVFQSYATRLAPGSGSSVLNVFVARTGKP